MALTSMPTYTETQTPTSTLTDTVTSTASFTVTRSPLPWTHWLTYIVQSGDTLYSLALDTGTTVEELMPANCLYDNRIYVGQILYLPRLPIKPPTITPPETVPPSPAPCSPMTSWPTYIVQEGDKLSSLANATHSTEWALMQANCLPTDYISPGQLLYVPILPERIQTPAPGSAQTDIPIATPTNTQSIYLKASPSFVPPLFKVTN
jgi:LysM repeat protein